MHVAAVAGGVGIYIAYCIRVKTTRLIVSTCVVVCVCVTSCSEDIVRMENPSYGHPAKDYRFSRDSSLFVGPTVSGQHGVTQCIDTVRILYTQYTVTTCSL